MPSLDPMDAADRLRKFKQTFEVNKSKWDNYASGEELFGLHVTRYPELEDIQVLNRFPQQSALCCLACGETELLPGVRFEDLS